MSFTLPSVTAEYDVAVIGGGTAGCFAAVSAADAGASVLLIEKNALLGGTMTAGGVNYPGLFFAWGRQIIGGHCWNAVLEMEKRGFCTIPPMDYSPAYHWEQQIRINTFAWSCYMDELCEKYGVNIRLHTMLSAAEEDETGVTLLLTGKEGLFSVRAKKIIDTTGDGNLVSMLGYPMTESEQLQPSTLAVLLSGYDPDALPADLAQKIADGVNAGELPPWTEPGNLIHGLQRMKFQFHHLTDHGSETSAGRTALEFRARKDAMDIVRFLHRIPELKDLQVTTFAAECGVRETKRIVGETVITAEDYINGRSYPDNICAAFYPIDLHVLPYDVLQTFFQPEVYGRVPYRALIPKGSRHLLAAGRIVSSDTDANSALRVQAPCMAEGQAAGCAAAIAARDNISVQAVDYDELKAELLRQGAIVP